MGKNEKWIAKTTYHLTEPVEDITFESRSYKYGPNRDYLVINGKAYPVTKKTISTLQREGLI